MMVIVSVLQIMLNLLDTFTLSPPANKKIAGRLGSFRYRLVLKATQTVVAVPLVKVLIFIVAGTCI